MKTLLIGGTGTLGTALTERLLKRGDQITCYSRGELAQKEYHAKFPDVNMVIGDVRDRDAVRHAIQGQDNVFLLAAIKHIDVAEKNPLECIKTNLFGAVNVGEAARDYGTKHVIYSNTDKAVLPITTYGYSKALAQNYLLSLNGRYKTKYSAFNWGNILASRGSVIQSFVEKLDTRQVIPITDKRMSRFWLTIDHVADYMLSSYVEASTTAAMIPPVKGATILRIVESLARIMGVKQYLVGDVGHRGIEKLYEVLESTHEGCLRSDTCEQYTDGELDELLQPIVRRLLAQKTVDSGVQGDHGTPLRGSAKAPRSRIPRDRPGRHLAGA